MFVFVMEGLAICWADRRTVQQPAPTNRHLPSHPIAAVVKSPVGGHFRSQAIAIIKAELKHAGAALILAATVLMTLT
jgi:hypothetical protein